MVMSLRRVRDDDAVRFLRWWNDRETRRFSGAGGPVTWDAHLAWFFENFANPHWYVGEVARDEVTHVDNGTIVRSVLRPVGACRIELGAEARNWISIVCDPLERGKGYGTELIRRGTATFQRDHGTLSPERFVYARIHALNEPSRRAFTKAGYTRVDTRGVWEIYRA